MHIKFSKGIMNRLSLQKSDVEKINKYDFMFSLTRKVFKSLIEMFNSMQSIGVLEECSTMLVHSNVLCPLHALPEECHLRCQHYSHTKGNMII